MDCGVRKNLTNFLNQNFPAVESFRAGICGARVGMEISEQDYQRLEALIGSDASPVGIDAKETHILILRKLEKIEERLERIEAKTDSLSSQEAQVELS